MDVLNFVMEHWADILVLILILIMIWSFFRRWLPKFGPMSDAEKIAVTTRLLENVAPAVLSIVIEAERIYGSGTGPLKRSYVIGEIYKLIPDEFKKYVKEENLEVILTLALAEAEKIWDENLQVKNFIRS